MTKIFFFFQLLVKLAKKGQNLTQYFRICTTFLLTLISPTIVENIFANPSRHLSAQSYQHKH